MERRYVLDLDDLYKECLRHIKNAEKRQIQNALSSLVHRKILINGKALTRQDLLANPNRNRILEIIRQEPGIHFSRIKACLNKESRTVQWHLKMLEKFDFIREERFGNNVVYFDFVQDKQHDRLYYYLHKDGAPAILKAILNHPGITMVNLIDQLQMPRSTLARKVNVLISEGFVSASYQANQMMCFSVVESVALLLQEIFKSGAYT
ncbi:MAG: winged helix-turn-helix transcriptional regulator [Candidatus Sigynarchaeota archaeon]